MQSYEAVYRPEASDDILKWKPASHNSVDFTLLAATSGPVMCDPRCAAAVDSGQGFFLGVYGRRETVLAFDVAQDAAGVMLETVKPARVEFPIGEDPVQYVGMVIECTFNQDTGIWHFMRERSKYAPPPTACCLLRDVRAACQALFVEAAAVYASRTRVTASSMCFRPWPIRLRFAGIHIPVLLSITGSQGPIWLSFTGALTVWRSAQGQGDAKRDWHVPQGHAFHLLSHR
jgi:hypothetical protein